MPNIDDRKLLAGIQVMGEQDCLYMGKTDIMCGLANNGKKYIYSTMGLKGK